MDRALRSLIVKKAAAFMKVATLAPSLGAVMQSPFTLKSQKIKAPGEGGVGVGLRKYAKKKDEWDHSSDSTWAKHKGKIVGGIALATAAGVGAKLLHTHWKGAKLPKTPPTAPPMPSAAQGGGARPKPHKVRKPGPTRDISLKDVAQSDRRNYREKKHKNKVYWKDKLQKMRDEG